MKKIFIVKFITLFCEILNKVCVGFFYHIFQVTHLNCELCLLSIQLSIKSIKKNWYLLGVSNQNDTLQFARNIIDCKKRVVCTLVIYKSNVKTKNM